MRTIEALSDANLDGLRRVIRAVERHPPRLAPNAAGSALGLLIVRELRGSAAQLSSAGPNHRSSVRRSTPRIWAARLRAPTRERTSWAYIRLSSSSVIWQSAASLRNVDDEPSGARGPANPRGQKRRWR